MASPLPLVADCGTFSLKAGLAEQPAPQAVLELPAESERSAGSSQAECWQLLLGNRFSTAGRPLVLGLPPTAPRRLREELCQLAFESLHTSALFVGSSPFLSVLGAGLSTALVLDIGEAGARAVQVEEGYPMLLSAVQSEVGGETLTAAMAALLREAGHELADGAAGLPAARAAKEQLGSVALHPAAGLGAPQLGPSGPSAPPPPPASCELPGGGTFRAERGEGARCAELLFRPDPSSPTGAWLPAAAARSAAADGPGARPAAAGVQDLVLESLRLQSDVNLRGGMLENILLIGGSSRFPGLEERLLGEVRLRSPWVAPGKTPEQVHLHARQDRGLLPWLGAAALAECDVLRQLWTTKAEYAALGPGAIHRSFV